MGSLIVRNIPDAIKDRLKERARKHGRSMEEEVREILRDATQDKKTKRAEGLGTRISKRFRDIGLDFDIPELRGYKIESPNFDE